MRPNIRHILVLAGSLAGAAQLASAEPAPLTSFVDPFIGTNPNPFTKIGYAFDTGNVFPGAVCPRGLLAWSPDTTHCNNIAGGYWYPDDKIEGFSLTHFSGRGRVCLKDIAFVPLLQPVVASPGAAWEQYASPFSHKNESAAPGYYQVKFDNGIQTELTATPRTGLARFTFPAQSTSTLLIRADGAVSVNGSEVSGHASKLYFVADFSTPFTSAKTWDGDKISDASSAKGGAILTFDTSKGLALLARAGISYTSVDNARDNLKREASGWDFAAEREKAVALWNKQLSCITVEGGSDDAKKVFYTALYHCSMHPNILEDANGQFLGIDSKVHSVTPGHQHQYQNIPAWDQHRSYSPLMAIMASGETSDVMQSLVNYAQEDASARPNGGGMPRWEQMNTNSGGMVGDGDCSIIATLYAFGVTRFDVKAAWESMDKGASQPGVTSDGHKVRGGLEQYMSLGYVPESAAVTLEYATDDFALSQMAASLGFKDKQMAYLKRAQNWKNLFNPETGYIQPRLADGKWVEKFAPRGGKGFIEGSAAQYFWLVNFNYRGLIDKMGGNEKAIERLDHFFTKTNAGMSSEFAYMGNEPDEETPWVYDFAGAPAKTQAIVRRVQNELFTTLPSGIPGNDDAGALSSWYIFSALGIYPVIPGVAGFVVGSPVFPKATLHMDGGKTIEFIGHNAAPGSPYVQSLKINGQAHASPWIPWLLISNGGALDFDLGDKPSQWGSDPKVAPPSFDSASAQ